MALGEDYSTNKPRYNEPEVFSPYWMSNTEGVDPSALSISYFRDCLKLKIRPMLPKPTEKKRWDDENAMTMFIQHTKARILVKCIEDVMDPEKPEIHNAGVNSGAEGFISFSDGSEFGQKGKYCLVLRKVNEQGAVTSNYVYEFKTGYHNAIINYDEKNNSSFDRQFYDSIEIEEFKDILKAYYIAITNATAYSVVNSLRFEHSKFHTKLNAIQDALGISYDKSGNNGNYSRGGRSYFSQQGNNGNKSSGSSSKNSMRESTIDDIENMMNAPEDDE